MNKKYKLLIIIIVICLIISIATMSYAFFTISNKTGSEETITSGTMALTLHDGAKVETGFMIPGEYIEKTFYVTNTGNLATSYDIYLSEVINDFADKTDLVYTLISNDGGYSTPSQVQVPSTETKIVDNQSIGTTTTHHYTLRITFLNKNEAQDDNQGKHFSGKLQINEYTAANNGGGNNGGSGNNDPGNNSGNNSGNENSVIASCPNCKFVFYRTLDIDNDYLTYGDGATPLTNEQLAKVKTTYQEIIAETGLSYFTAVDINSTTNIIERGYVCVLKNGTPVCAEGTQDGSGYDDNRLNVLPQLACDDSYFSFDCVSDDEVSLDVDDIGNVNASDDYGTCGVGGDGHISCLVYAD